MHVTTTRDGHKAVVAVSGDLDAETSPKLEAEFAGLRNLGTRSLVVDMSGVAFLGSSGLSVLIVAQRGVEEFTLLRGNNMVDRLIALTGLDRLYGAD